MSSKILYFYFTSRKNGVVLKNVVIYMKIYKTESNEDQTVLVSFHSAEFEDDKPYDSANNKEDKSGV